METLSFLKNYNNKFCCDVFTTIRPHRVSRKVGDVVQLKLKLDSGTVVGENAEIKHLATMLLKDIPEYTLATDVGVCKKFAIQMFRDIYTKYGIDVDKTMFDIILLKHLN